MSENIQININKKIQFRYKRMSKNSGGRSDKSDQYKWSGIKNEFKLFQAWLRSDAQEETYGEEIVIIIFGEGEFTP